MKLASPIDLIVDFQQGTGLLIPQCSQRVHLVTTQPTSKRYSCPPCRVIHLSEVFQGVRYLLRLINTSVDTIFVFSIDNHNLTIIESDFVPIEPYTNTSVLIGIGESSPS